MAQKAQQFTTYLRDLNHDLLQKATQHPFLDQAAKATLPTDMVVQWLAQDRLYAISYVSFISNLLSKIRVPTAADRQTQLHWRITSCLIDCLTNIRTEIKLFEDVARDHGWLMTFGNALPDPPTRTYQDLFAGASQSHVSLLKGLTTLWATEKCYLLAWSWAKNQMPEQTKKGDVMQEIFIPNWSSKEFSEFVDELEALVNELHEQETKANNILALNEAELVWFQVLDVEEKFWPNTSA